MELPHSPACERNKDIILDKLKNYSPLGEVLEMGHGTGQHSVHFCAHMDVKWFPADVPANNWMMAERMRTANLLNLFPPIAFEVGPKPIEKQIGRDFDSVFTANTFHIMAENHVVEFCEGLHKILRPEGRFFLYGPFKFEGKFTSESNQNFDASLKLSHPHMGIRDFEMITEELGQTGINFKDRHDLPANNQLLVFQYETRN